MIQIRKSGERGHFDHGWLDTYHSFSFADYYDPGFTGFSDLLVINEDRVQPGEGFGMHGHRNMEIITYVLDGALEHRDSMGNGSVIRPGDVQRMSAGRGVRHSEFNHSKEKPVHLLQIWIATRNDGIEPSYEERRFSSEEKTNRLKLVVSPEGEEGSVRIFQDARVFASVLDEGKEASLAIAPGRQAWVQLAHGVIELNGRLLEAGDGAALSDEQMVRIVARSPAEVLVFDLRGAIGSGRRP